MESVTVTLPTVFLSTSSARRTTNKRKQQNLQDHISIHVLREEDDQTLQRELSGPQKFLSTSSARRTTAEFQFFAVIRHISIHVLREEDDNASKKP